MKADASELSFAEAELMPEMNRRFEQKEGWLGGDGDYSVALPGRRTLWLFSDTWVGRVRDGKRADASLVNNTAAVQDGAGSKAKLRFFISRSADQKPAALITPEDQRGWFWPQAGFYDHHRLYIFLSQIEKTLDPSVFGFREIGKTLGVVDNPESAPTSWRIRQRKLPFASFTPERVLNFGAAVLRQGDYLYIFGTDLEFQGKAQRRYLVAARTPVAAVDDFDAWRFYGEGKWQTNAAWADHLVDGIASELSVSYLPKFKRYALVYTEDGFSPRILVRTAGTPYGPWSTAATLYTCPEMSRDKRIFCYAAKAHASQAGQDELVVSYVANSLDFWQPLGDASLYWPRFIRVKVRRQT